jgi:hypothetical protein
MVNLPDGSYTFQTQAGFVKADGTIGKPRSQWLGSYTRFTVSGKDLALPPEPISSEPGPSTAIHAHLDPQSLHAHGPLSDVCSGTVRTSVSSPGQASGKQPVQFPNIWLSRAGALSEVSLHIKSTIQNGGSLEFADLEPGSYWVHADEIDNGYVAAITAAGVDMSHEPLVVGLNGKSASLEITLSTACGALRLNYAWPKPLRDSVGIGRVFFGILVPQFAGFAGQHTVMFEQDRGDDVTIGNLAPGHYKFYLVRRERGIEFRNPQSAQTALPPGQDVWVKPGAKAEVSVIEPPTE